MKQLLTFGLIVLFFTACSSNKLDRDTAFKLLKEQKLYPKIIDLEIYTADPVEAKKIMESGLEKDGYIAVKRTQALSEIGSPIVSFTDKAKAYLLPLTEEDRESQIQRVKVADETLEEVSGVQMLNDGKNAVVEYKTTFKNITPFSKLVEYDLGKTNTHKADFALFDDVWRIEK